MKISMTRPVAVGGFMARLGLPALLERISVHGRLWLAVDHIRQCRVRHCMEGVVTFPVQSRPAERKPCAVRSDRCDLCNRIDIAVLDNGLPAVSLGETNAG